MPAFTESRVVNAAGLVQGIVLVTFPAASTVLTDPADYGLSSTQYGALFVPQVVTAITASLLGGTLARRLAIKRVALAGLAASLAAMVLLLVSVPFQGRAGVFPLLLVATAFVGTGFGLTVPALNTLATDLHPGGADRAVLVLNALLGLGTALAPVFVALFVGLGAWWGLPTLTGVLVVAVIAAFAPLPLHPTPVTGAPAGGAAVPLRFWLFGAVAVLYGICETMNGNWAQLEMTGHLGASTAVASLALTTFWAMVTLGRILFAALQRTVPSAVTYHVLPFVLALAMALIAALPAGSAAAGIAAFALAGLGCSALLPLTISFGEAQLPSMAAAAAGSIIAAYQLGYGIAAFGTGPLQDHGVSLSSLFGVAAVIAVAMGVCSFAVTTTTVRTARPTGATRGATS